MLKTETMKTKHLKHFFALMLLLLFGFVAKAQCKYVDKQSNPESTGIELPCNFPIYAYTGDFNQDKINFETEVTNFKNVYPQLKDVIFLPAETPYNPNIYIEISREAFEALSPEKQKTVTGLSQFYHIKS